MVFPLVAATANAGAGCPTSSPFGGAGACPLAPLPAAAKKTSAQRWGFRMGRTIAQALLAWAPGRKLPARVEQSMIPQNRLEQLLVSASEEPEKRLDFYRQFLEFDVFVIGSIEEGKSRLAFFDVEGEKVLPIFSSLERLREAVESEQPVVQMSARALFAGMPPDVRLVLNPGSAFGKEFSADEIAAMLEGSLAAEVDQIDVPDDEEVLLGQPARYPRALVDGLCDRFREVPSIQQAYLAQVFVPSSGEP